MERIFGEEEEFRERTEPEGVRVGFEVEDGSEDLVRGRERFGRGWVAKKRIGPDLDEALESTVGDEVFGMEELHGGGAGVVAGVEPALDAGAVVGDSGAEADRGFHDVERDGALEEAGNAYA